MNRILLHQKGAIATSLEQQRAIESASHNSHDTDSDDDDDDEDEKDGVDGHRRLGSNNVQHMQMSYIEEAFHNRQTFTCPLVKQLLATGTSGADLSPEDIDIVAAMGDALSAC